MSPTSAEPIEVHAAGGVVWRSTEAGTEVLLVHRPRYDDWSHPKGKLESGETSEQCALREVLEETGLSCELGNELPPVTYRDRKGRRKQVRYWAMQPQDPDTARDPDDEVDELCWMVLPAAARRLSYPHDVEVLKSLHRVR